MLTNAPNSVQFNALYEKINTRVKQYIDLKEGAWTTEANEFLNETLPSVQTQQSIHALLQQTEDFCQNRITSSIKKYLPLSLTLGAYSGRTGSPLAVDLLAYCAEVKMVLEQPMNSEKAACTIESLTQESQPTHTEVVSDIIEAETTKAEPSNIASQMQQLSLSATTPISPPPLTPRISRESEPTSCASSSSDCNREPEEPTDSTTSEEELDIFDKIKLGVFGGAEGQEKLIKKLEAELEKERAKTQRLSELNRVLESTIKVQTEEIATFYQLQHHKIRASTASGRIQSSHSDEVKPDSVRMCKPA